MAKRIGIVCLSGRGHLYPAAALGQLLIKRGHEVIFFNRTITRAIVEAHMIPFRALDGVRKNVVVNPYPESKSANGPNTLNTIYNHASLILQEANKIFREEQIEALLVDQADLASGTVANLLKIPFVTLALIPPVYLDDEIPPFIYNWQPTGSGTDLSRNRRGNSLMRRMLSPTLELVNNQRRVWGLEPFVDIRDTFSRTAIISQMPQALEFPRSTLPPHFYYTGPFISSDGSRRSAFPWSRLDGRPLVYASMGTVRNNASIVFEIIAQACAYYDVQLVISLGGMFLTPDKVSELPGDPIIVHYAPQIAILKKASLMISHGGINSTLESISCGVPMIAIPFTDDQPGIAARIEWFGLGLMIPVRRLTVSRLAECIQLIVRDQSFYLRAKIMQDEMQNIDGLDLAGDVIERVIM